MLELNENEKKKKKIKLYKIINFFFQEGHSGVHFEQ